MREKEELKLANLISGYCHRVNLPNSPFDGKYIIEDMFELINVIDEYYSKKKKIKEDEV